MYESDFYLECQSCGTVLKHVSRFNSAEHQKWTNRVADNPYNYVLFCDECTSRGYHIEKEFR